MSNETNFDGRTETDVQNKVEEPTRFKVFLHNDNYTTMDFVVDILCRIFHKNIDSATAIMLEVHTKGIAPCGIYTREVAETRVALVRSAAHKAGYPLKCTMEEA